MSIAKPLIQFQSRYVDIDGHQLHYFDEGEGDVILISHGIPEWSIIYADLVKQLSKKFRCIVPDHLGFGLSDRSLTADLSVQAHADRLIKFTEALHLKNINLYVHDLGGPIGIGALTVKPGLFTSLSISNSFCWNLEGSNAAKPLKMMSGALGRWLYLNYGFSVKFMAKNGFADKRRFAEVREMFMFPHQTKEDRYANYQLMLEMLRSGTYFDASLKKLKTLNIPVHIIWGVKDKFFDNTYFNRWKIELPLATLHELQNSGHFPQLEETRQLSGYIELINNSTIS